MPIHGLSVKNKTEIASLYNGDVQLHFSPSGHRYKVFVKGAEQFGTCGVTTIVGVLDKPQLVQWSANMTNEAWIEGLQKADKIDELTISTIAKSAPLAWRVKRDSAGDLGTLIHAWIEEHIKWKLGKSEKPDMPVHEGMVSATLKFLQWEKEEGITYTDTEKKIYSIKHNIAGTCDFLYVTRDGKLGIGDIKTSKGIYDTYFLQVAGYRYMLEEERRYATGVTPIPYEEMTIVKVGKDGSDMQVKKIDDYQKYAKAFLACSVLYRTMKKGTNY